MERPLLCSNAALYGKDNRRVAAIRPWLDYHRVNLGVRDFLVFVDSEVEDTEWTKDVDLRTLLTHATVISESRPSGASTSRTA